MLSIYWKVQCHWNIFKLFQPCGKTPYFGDRTSEKKVISSSPTNGILLKELFECRRPIPSGTRGSPRCSQVGTLKGLGCTYEDVNTVLCVLSPPGKQLTDDGENIDKRRYKVHLLSKTHGYPFIQHFALFLHQFPFLEQFTSIQQIPVCRTGYR